MNSSASSLTVQRFRRRANRTRAALAQNQSIPRLSVYRSLRHISAQIIDDISGITLVSASDIISTSTATKTEKSRLVGAELAAKALAKNISAVRFDRGAYQYHGRVAAVAEAARAAGLTF